MFTKPTLANNRYELISTLGQGGMACVFKARDTRMKVDKAIKIPNHQCLTNKRIRDRFENEATTMAMLHHKNIVVVHDIQDEIYEDPAGIVSIKIVYMVMEMVSGGSLKDRIDTHGPLHPQQALEAAIQMAEGLGYAHQNNVVHRDVKLDNVLIGSDNTLKVTDFGIAQIDGGSGMTQTGATMGTLAYMAPEQKLSSRRATALSDLYSVGASLYLMLTNRNPSELYAEDIQESGFVDLPDAAGAVLAKCCHIDTEKRYQSASELIEALEGLKEHFGTLPEDSTPFYVPGEPKDLNPDDIARRERKVTSMWTTLLGIDPEELSGTIPRPKVVSPTPANDTALDFGTFDSLGDTDTALEVLGLDLSPEEPSPAGMNAPHKRDDHVADTNNIKETTAHSNSAAETSSSYKGIFIAGIIGLVGFGGWFMTQDDPKPDTAAVAPTTVEQKPVQEQTLSPVNTVETSKGPPKKTPEITSSKSEKTTESKKPEEPKQVAKPKPKPAAKKTTPKPAVAKSTSPKADKPTEKMIEAAPTTFGSIVVNSIPYSEVYVKGKPAKCEGKSNNRTLCKLTLPTGWNTVVLRTKDETEKSLKVKVAEGNNKTKCWHFGKDDDCKR